MFQNLFQNKNWQNGTLQTLNLHCVSGKKHTNFETQNYKDRF